MFSVTCRRVKETAQAAVFRRSCLLYGQVNIGKLLRCDSPRALSHYRTAKNKSVRKLTYPAALYMRQSYNCQPGRTRGKQTLSAAPQTTAGLYKYILQAERPEICIFAEIRPFGFYECERNESDAAATFKFFHKLHSNF